MFKQSRNRVPTLEVKVGDLVLGNYHPVRIQTMTTTDTMDTAATIEQSIRCIEAGAELVRITAPSKREAENLMNIREGLRARGYNTPLVADIHFTPNAAEIAARMVEKVRINPGNYIDKKKFEYIDYTDRAYEAEIEKIRERFTPLVRICKAYGTAMRIGTNHGSLSDRIMSRYGDTAMGMVESAMEFLRICREEDFHQVVLSMKSSNPLVMVQAYRLLVKTMTEDFGVNYPLHLGVTEAGDGEDGRIKSAIGIGTLLEEGIGDTIRVSLTEDPEFEIPVCRDIVKRYVSRNMEPKPFPGSPALPYSPYEYARRQTVAEDLVGGAHVPVVVADFSRAPVSRGDLDSVGYRYEAALDKWHIGDAAADYLYTGAHVPDFPLPGGLRVLCDYRSWVTADENPQRFPFIDAAEDAFPRLPDEQLVFLQVDCNDSGAVARAIEIASGTGRVVLCVRSSHPFPMLSVRNFIVRLMEQRVRCPIILVVRTEASSIDEQLIHFSTEAGALLLDGLGDGLWLVNDPVRLVDKKVSGRTYLRADNTNQFLNNTSFSILQATRTRISKTEYISCPSCGRTLFDLQETTARIRAVTNHLKGVKIAIMGCIVNGPGEMADADFGYVGSGPGKITLYKGKEIVKRAVNSEVAVEELISLLKENGAWTEPALAYPAV